MPVPEEWHKTADLRGLAKRPCIEDSRGHVREHLSPSHLDKAKLPCRCFYP